VDRCRYRGAVAGCLRASEPGGLAHAIPNRHTHRREPMGKSSPRGGYARPAQTSAPTGAAAQHRVNNTAGRRATCGDGPWWTRQVSRGVGLCQVGERLQPGNPSPHRLPSVWRAAPIIQLCAGCGLPGNASLAAHSGGHARGRDRPLTTLRVQRAGMADAGSREKERVTRRLVLAVLWASVLPVNCLTPAAARVVPELAAPEDARTDLSTAADGPRLPFRDGPRPRFARAPR
jgi:hypothetical protein